MWTYYKYSSGKYKAYTSITTPSSAGSAYTALTFPSFHINQLFIGATVDLPSTTSNGTEGYRGNKNGITKLFFGYASRGALVKLEGTWK